MAWFYRGGRKPIAHWFDPGGERSLCLRLKPDARGVAWRHPQHDQHVPLCALCRSRLVGRKATAKAPTPVRPVGVVEKSGPDSSR